MNNTYGIVKPGMVDIEKDVEIWYHYMPSRTGVDASFQNFKRYNEVSDILSYATIDPNDNSFNDNRLIGMYNLNLPIDVFGNKGIYTIYIKPREYRCTIKDVGVLSAYENTRGIVIDLSELDEGTNESFFANNNLIGYRVEYFTQRTYDRQREDFYRIITSNNKCEPVTQALTSVYSTSNGYRFNDAGTLCFLTVTPSSNPSFRSNSQPYIGAPSQTITITNTKFDPITIEVEIVEHDIETLSIMQEGNVVRDLDRGRVTHYNFDNEIYKQYEFFTVKDNYTTNSIAEVKVDTSDSVDTSLDINDLISE